MEHSPSLARWGGIAGIAGIGIGIIAGVLGLINPSAIYAPPPGVYNYATQLGRIVAILHGVMVLGFTAAFRGYHLIGAVGRGTLGMIASGLSALGNLGVALGFFHAALIGAASPLTMLGFLILPCSINSVEPSDLSQAITGGYFRRTSIIISVSSKIIASSIAPLGCFAVLMPEAGGHVIIS